jgi:hypothetical protein
MQARCQTLAFEALPGAPTQMAAYACDRWGRPIHERGLELD